MGEIKTSGNSFVFINHLYNEMTRKKQHQYSLPVTYNHFKISFGLVAWKNQHIAVTVTVSSHITLSIYNE